MSYRTILVHVDDDPGAAARYAVAVGIAVAGQDQLTGVASTGLNRFYRETVAMDHGSPAIAPYIATLRQRATSALAQFASVVESHGGLTAERRQTDDAPYDTLSILGRYSDVCVLGHAAPDRHGGGRVPSLAPDVAASSGCPVLVVPDGAAPKAPFERILLAWNGSREAARAMWFAYPLMRRASVVEVAILGELQGEREDVKPVVEISQALARHAIVADVLQRRGDGDAGHALLALAAERGTDLLVMGCYGHSRVRETLLGGATRSVLSAMNLPVFMAA